MPVPAIAERIGVALERGVEVVFLAPAKPEDHVRVARRNPQRRASFEQIEALGLHANFTLAGLAAPAEMSGWRSIHVHAKIMLIDDAWATVGSCNLHANSLFGHTEMNVSFWDATVVRRLRCRLLAEHLGQDTADLDDRAALRLYRQTAVHNRCCMEQRETSWKGLAITLEPSTYGE